MVHATIKFKLSFHAPGYSAELTCSYILWSENNGTLPKVDMLWPQTQYPPMNGTGHMMRVDGEETLSISFSLHEWNLSVA